MRRKALTLSISPPLYARITTIALALLTAIVFTGAAVRLTGSGAECSVWVRITQSNAPSGSQPGSRRSPTSVALGLAADASTTSERVTRPPPKRRVYVGS